MSLVERLTADMKQAMKNKEKDKLSVIRMVKSSLQNEEIKFNKDALTDEEELTVLNRELKQRKDSLLEFTKADRSDLAEKTQQEIDVLMNYLPEQLTEEELSTIVQETIKELNASSKADMGKVMSAIMPKIKGKADGSIVNRYVLQHLDK
jgi:uncharacterized protein YqeY